MDDEDASDGLPYNESDFRNQVRKMRQRGTTDEEIISFYKDLGYMDLDEVRTGTPEINDVMRWVRSELVRVKPDGGTLSDTVKVVILEVDDSLGEIVWESASQEADIRPMPGFEGKGVVCKIGKGPAATTLRVNVNLGQFVVALELAAPNLRGIIGALRQSLDSAAGMDSPEEPQ